MLIKQIKLSNFRNHKNAVFKLAKSNLFFGSNGSGKTSILESIAFASTLRSPRTARLKELITWGKRESLVKLETKNKNKKSTIRFLLAKNQGSQNLKQFSLNGKRIETKEIIGYIRTVYFSPETLEIITGSPSIRRRFLDILLSQIDRRYLADLIEYKKIVLNRNKLIKEVAEGRRGREEMFFWNESLVASGSRLIKKRKRLIFLLSKLLKRYYKRISGDQDAQAGIKYLPSVKKEKNRLIRNSFREKIEQEFEWELKYKSTLVGPHRDDLVFLLNKRKARIYASRGETRSLIVSLKLAEARHIYQETGDKPIILLDDIYSELDEKRSFFLSKALFDQNQTLTTTSDKGLIEGLTKSGAKIIKLEKRKVSVK